MFSNRQPLRDDVFEVMKGKPKPKLLERDNAFMRLSQKFNGFVNTFYSDM